MNSVVSYLALAIKFSTVFLFGATGEIINQKSGHLNMGTPGIMYLGALGGIIGERIYIMSIPATQPLNPFMIVFMPIVFSILFGALGGLIFSFFTVTLHCNQNVTGLTLTTFHDASIDIRDYAERLLSRRRAKVDLAMADKKRDHEK